MNINGKSQFIIALIALLFTAAQLSSSSPIENEALLVIETLKYITSINYFQH